MDGAYRQMSTLNPNYQEILGGAGQEVTGRDEYNHPSPHARGIKTPTT